MPEPTPDLNQIAGPSPEQVSQLPDARTELEDVKYRNDRLQIENEGLKQNIAERKKYAHHSFFLVVGWLLGVAILLILQGFRIHCFYLDNGVFKVLLGSTSAGIIGIFFAVANYLFHFEGPPKPK